MSDQPPKITPPTPKIYWSKDGPFTTAILTALAFYVVPIVLDRLRGIDHGAHDESE